MDKVKHIFFDLDHTLWDFETNSRQAIAEIFIDNNLEKKLGIDVKIFTARYELHNNHYWKLYRENRISKSRLRVARFQSVLSDFRLEDKPLARQLADAYLEISPVKTQLFDGAPEVLEKLQQKYSLHIITNGFEEVQWLKIRSSKIDHFFEHVITSEMAKAKKPNPRIFQVAQSLTQSEPEESLMIGDNLEVDVKGAKALGWHAIHFNPMEQNSDGSSITSLRELLPLLI